LTRTREQRLDRKALKQDGLLNFTNRVGLYTQKHMNLALGVLAGVVVIVGLGLLWRNDARQKAVQAGQGLSQVIQAYAMNQPEQVIERANALQSTSPGTPGSVAAKYLAGAAQLQLGRFAEAEQSLRSYLESSAKMPMYENAARGALGAALESQSKFAEAAGEYQTLAAKLEGTAALRAKLDAARALRQAGSIDEARGLLEQLAKEPVTAQEARLQLAIIGNLAAARP